MSVRPYTSWLIAALIIGSPIAFADETTPATPTTIETTAVPSPELMQKRADLMSKIETLKGAGVGVGPYLKQMEEVDTLMHSNGNDAQVLKRYESLSAAIKDQASRTETMKNFHPTAPTASQSSGGSLGGGSNASTAALVDSVKGKFGGKLPGGLSQDDVMKMLANPKAQQMLEKLK